MEVAQRPLLCSGNDAGTRAVGDRIVPSPNGENGGAGRDSKGRFTPGNPGGPGNPHARQIGLLRSAMIEAVSPEDMRSIALELVDKAKDGNLAAARLLFDRVLGRPLEADILERIEALEAQSRTG